MNEEMMSGSSDRFLSGKVALVTGATGGIGEAIAKGLASKGANLICTGFGDEETIGKLLSGLRSLYQVAAVHVPADLAMADGVSSLYSQSLTAFPKGIDILVNNAGFQFVSPIESFPLEKWNQMIAVMLTAPFHLTQLCMGAMKDKGWGRVINISSAHGHVASPNKTAYVSVKHGLVGLTKTVAVEVAGTGVTCNAICPGYVKTPLFMKQAAARAEENGTTIEEGMKSILHVHASKQPVTVESIADAAVFLCSSAADQMTGSSMLMDAGWTAQ